MKCKWCLGDNLYEDYHDNEWGVPVYEDKILFEFMVLESAQAGLSWITILRKRENYRKAYDDFQVERVASYGEDKVEELLTDAGIVRNRKKIEASINNAKCFIEVQREYGSFSAYLWDFAGGSPIDGRLKSTDDPAATTELSDALSKDLKKRGFKFLGSTTLYAYLQAVGVVNDHITTCPRYEEIKKSWD